MAMEPTKKYTLEANSELRFENRQHICKTGSRKIDVELISGSAEIFGMALVARQRYSLFSRASIFTHDGCVIHLNGNRDITLVTVETPMLKYINYHLSLEQLRIKADEQNTQGPIVLVVGATDVGKSTLCKILLNYTIRAGRNPIFVDLDVGQGSLSIPGTIGAILTEQSSLVEKDFSQKNPIVYYYGNVDPARNITLLNVLTLNLAENILERLQCNDRTKSSGIIINTCGWIKDGGYKYLLNVLKAFKVTSVIVLNHKHLYNDLLLAGVSKSVQIKFLPKSKGARKRPRVIRKNTRGMCIGEYFYGNRSSLGYPHSLVINWSDIIIYNIGEFSFTSADPSKSFEMRAEDDRTKMVIVQPSDALLYHVLAISLAAIDTNEDIIKVNVAGFISVKSVDMEKQTLTVLSPQPNPLPNNILLLFDLKFEDKH